MVLFISNAKRTIPDFIIHHKEQCLARGELPDFRLSSGSNQQAETARQPLQVLSKQSSDRQHLDGV